MSRKNAKQFGQLAGPWLDIPGIGGCFDAGTSVPSDGAVGYAPGCIFIKTNASGVAAIYWNVGTRASADFNLLNGGLDLSTLVTTATELNLLSGLLATAAEINRANKLSTREISAAGANLTVTLALHDGKTIKLDQATGTAVTLPAMSGSGARYRFVCSVATAAGSQVITATGAHLFGSLLQNTDSANGSSGFTTASIPAGGSTVITLNGTTQGGRKGDWIEIEDVATSVGIIRGQLNASGSEATPFS